MAAKNVVVPKLAKDERAFKLDSGDHIKVCMRKQTLEPKQYELAKEQYLAIKVEVPLIDDQGEPIVDENGIAVVCPAKVHSILSSALAEKKTTIEEQVAIATTEAIERAENYLAARRAWNFLP